MLPKLGMGELIVILLIVVVLFGANRLPQLGKGLGEGIRSFKKSFGGDDDEKPNNAGSGTRSGDQHNGPKAS
jgi:sec-independent protein translocase protein TatA